MKKVVLYIHGKGGNYLEAEQYKKNGIGFDIIGIDFNEYLPWIVQNQISGKRIRKRFVRERRNPYGLWGNIIMEIFMLCQGKPYNMECPHRNPICRA